MVPREVDLLGEGPYPVKRIRATTIHDLFSQQALSPGER